MKNCDRFFPPPKKKKMFKIPDVLRIHKSGPKGFYIDKRFRMMHPIGPEVHNLEQEPFSSVNARRYQILFCLVQYQ